MTKKSSMEITTMKKTSNWIKKNPYAAFLIVAALAGGQGDNLFDYFVGDVPDPREIRMADVERRLGKVERKHK